ncbi:hypothetical protein CR513_23828, partial [Mucuna pruriens]
MIMMGNGEVESKSSSDDEMSSLEDYSIIKVVEAVDGVVLVTRHALSIYPKEDGDMEQREHIFHTRCLVQGKLCSMIIDGGSCTNVASTILVEKIKLQTAKHPRPYNLQRLSNIGEVKFDKQVSMFVAIGNYKDEVLCDMVLMEAGHILLGRPWQFDRKDVQYVFPAEVPSDLPSIKGIEHHIDLNLGATFFNIPAYRNRLASWKECLSHLEELHAKVRVNIEKKNGQYARQANKGHVTMTFEPANCVWVHRGKERFPTQRKYKTNDKLDLSTVYGEEFDSRKNLFEEGGNDRDPTNKVKDL